MARPRCSQNQREAPLQSQSTFLDLLEAGFDWRLYIQRNSIQRAGNSVEPIRHAEEDTGLALDEMGKIDAHFSSRKRSMSWAIKP